MILGPSKNERTSEPYVEEENVFLSMEAFEHEVEEVFQAYALLMTKSNPDGSLLPPEILTLLLDISRYYF